jgi:hypothetical protein
VTYSRRGWTFGAEHELADWPWERPLLAGFGLDQHDITMVNSSGVANDPNGKVYFLGGEFNTPPTDTPEGQCELLEQLTAYYPEATVNYRSNLHLHIRVPGLREDLAALKRLQAHIHEWMPKALPVIQSIPKPSREQYPDETEYHGAMRRYRRRKVSHQTLLLPDRVARQLAAVTPKEFFENEVPRVKATGVPMWHAQPRLCVSSRQLIQTDTIEFRHFAGTLSPGKLLLAFIWCEGYLERALEGAPIDDMLTKFRTNDFPVFPTYIHPMEVRYRMTVHDGTVPAADIAKNIARIDAEWKANPMRKGESLVAYWKRRS